MAKPINLGSISLGNDEDDNNTVRPLVTQPSGAIDLGSINLDDDSPTGSDSDYTEEVETLGDYGREFTEGVFGGIGNIAAGIAELGAATFDMATGANTVQYVQDLNKKYRKTFGIDPQGIFGKGTEALVQFALPGMIGAKVARSALGLTRLKKMSDLNKVRPSKVEAVRGVKGGLTTGEKFKLGTAEVAGAVSADIMTYTDGTETIGDFFEGGYTKTDQRIGLSGRENALRVLSNKLKGGVEAGVATVATAPVAGIAGSALNTIATSKYSPVSHVLRGAATGVRKAGAKMTRWAEEAELDYMRGSNRKGFTAGVTQALSWLRPRSFLPDDVFEARSKIQGSIDATISAAEKTGRQLDTAIEDTLKEINRTPGTPTTKVEMYDAVNEFLTANNRDARARALRRLKANNVRRVAMRMRADVDALSNQVMNSATLARMDEIIDPKTGMPKGEMVREVIARNTNSYLRRRFRMFEDEKFRPDAEVIATAKQKFKEKPDLLAFELGKVYSKNPDKYSLASLGIEKVDGKWRMTTTEPSDELLDKAVEGFINRYKPSVGSKNKVDRVAIEKVNLGMFKDRVDMPKFQRDLLGEITDAREAYLGTVADLSEFIATDKYFGEIARLVDEHTINEAGAKVYKNPGIREFYRDVMGETGKMDGAIDGFVTLGEEYGALQGFAVQKDIHGDMTRLVIRDLGFGTNMLRAAYSTLLKGKGAAQYALTVLSPVTQLRNVTSAALFATMQGNVGRGATLSESFNLVWRPFREGGDLEQMAEFQKMQRLGVFGNQAELKEIKENISKGLGFSEEATVGGLPVGRGYAQGFYTGTTFRPFMGVAEGMQRKADAFLKQQGKKAEQVYQGSDDLWKYYNYKFERQKIVNALDGLSRKDRIDYLTKGKGLPTNKTYEDLLDEYAAKIVKNVVPNYNYAPNAIKSLRQLPIGNFIAFPYEIYRTTANTVRQGLEEFTSDNEAIRRIGARRLSGALATTTMVPAGLTELTHSMSGVTDEETEAYKRSVAMPWERNATLLPIGRSEDGVPIYINYSYTNPYDTIGKAVQGAMNQVAEGKATNQSLTGTAKGLYLDGVVADAFAEALDEGLLKPFTEESIFAGLVRDVVPEEVPLLFGRGGQRITGAKVYNSEDDLSTKLQKSFNHVFFNMMPPVVPVDVKGGELEPSRLIQGISNAFAAPGENKRDRYGRERDLTTELTRVLTGISQTEADVPMALKYKGYEYGQRFRAAGNMFTSIASRQNATAEDFINGYTKAQEARFRIKKEMYQMVLDMRTMGMSNSQIRRVFKRSNIGGYEDVLRGRYKPQEISKFVLNNARANNLDIPRSEIRAIQRAFRNRRFDDTPPVDTAPRPRVNLGDITLPPDNAPDFTPSAPVSPPSPQGAAPAVGPTSSNIMGPAAPQQPVAPDLLGSNPITAMRNAQIAARRKIT